MTSIQRIQQLADEAGATAEDKGLEPHVFEHDYEFERIPPFPFPNLGSYLPEGWRVVDEDVQEELFADSSGFGAEDEPALSVTQLLDKLRELFAAHPDWGYGLTTVGQFQVNIGVFEPAK
jgi:hypothetical protein